jgi:hypothetical protein
VHLTDNSFVFVCVGLAMLLHFPVQSEGENIMQWVITFVAMVAGLIFSLVVAVITEELIFGRLMALFFLRSAVRPTMASKNGTQR